MTDHQPASQAKPARDLAFGLRRSHPGLFAVTLSFVVLHGGAAVDLIAGGMPRHNVGVWVGLFSVAPLQVWAALHAICCVGLVGGLVVGHQWVRGVFALSTLTLWAEGGNFLYVALQERTASFSSFVCYVVLALIATRAVVEPRAVLSGVVLEREASRNQRTGGEPE